MFNYVKKLQYPVSIKNPDPKAAMIILTQYGGGYGKRIYRLLLLTYGYFAPLFRMLGIIPAHGL